MTKLQDRPQPEDGPRERLIEAARWVFATRGVEFATVKEIAQAAGVNHGLVHYYFGGKDRLLLEMVRQTAAIYGEQFADLQRNADVTALARQAFAMSIAIVRSDPDRTRLQAELLLLGLRRPALHQDVAALLAEATQRTATIVAAARGRDHVTVDDLSTAAVLRSAFDGLAMQLAYDPDFDVESAVEALRRII